MAREGNKTMVKLKSVLAAALVCTAAVSKRKLSSLLGDSEQVFWKFNYQNGLYGTYYCHGANNLELSKSRGLMS